MFTINYTGIDTVGKLLQPARFSIGLAAGMQAALEYLKGLVQKEIEPHKDTGTSMGRIFTEMHGSPVALEGKVWNADLYVQIMEEGRTPGSKPPPSAAIGPWLERHGIDISLAYVVARAIGRRGLPAHHMFKNAAAQGGKQAVALISAEITKQL